MEEATKLFAEKGFRDASIQEIAAASGISKGAFYLHFKSKEVLLLSILEHHHQAFEERAAQIERKDLSPREKFVQWMDLTFDEITKHREFIITQIREQALPFNKEIENYFREKERVSYFKFEKNLIRMYGEDVQPFLGDLIVLAKGMLKSYLELIILDAIRFDRQQLPVFLLEVMDSLVEGLKKSSLSPIITENSINDLWKTLRSTRLGSTEYLLEMLQESRKNAHDNEEITVTLDVLEDELKSDPIRKPVIKGMIANLEPYETYSGLIDAFNRYVLQE